MLQIVKVRQYIDAMRLRGFNAQQVLRGTGIKPEALQLALPISLAQSQILIHNMLDITGNNALGFDLGMDVTPSDMGVVGQGMIASPTFRDTINLWAAYAPTLYGSLIQLSLLENNNTWKMLLSEELHPGSCYQFCLEEYLALVLNLGNRMYGKPVNYKQLDISYSAPPHYQRYEQLFECRVNFNAARNCITVQSPGLDDFIQTRDEYLHPIYEQYCKRQSNKPVIKTSYACKVHNYLLQSLGRPPSFERMAKELGTSTATLRRRLKDEKLTFRELHNEFRRDFALEYLRTTELTAKEVAYLLGYRDTKPFLRAFKLWTKMTVGEYKRGKI